MADTLYIDYGVLSVSPAYQHTDNIGITYESHTFNSCKSAAKVVKISEICKRNQRKVMKKVFLKRD